MNSSMDNDGARERKKEIGKGGRLCFALFWAMGFGVWGGSALAENEATYTNQAYGFSFVYPAVYNDTQPCSLKEQVRADADPLLTLGNRVSLTVYPSTSMNNYLDREIKESGAQEIEYEVISLPSGRAERFSYAIGGMGRLVGEYRVAHKGNLLRFSAMSGPACVSGREEMLDLEAIVHSLALF